MKCAGIKTLSVHPLAGGITTHAHGTLVLLHILRIFGDTGAYARGGGAMPEGNGEKTDADSDSRPDFGQIKGQARRQMIGEVGQDAHAEEQSKHKDTRFNQSGCRVKA